MVTNWLKPEQHRGFESAVFPASSSPMPGFSLLDTAVLDLTLGLFCIFITAVCGAMPPASLSSFKLLN